MIEDIDTWFLRLDSSAEEVEEEGKKYQIDPLKHKIIINPTQRLCYYHIFSKLESLQKYGSKTTSLSFGIGCCCRNLYDLCNILYNFPDLIEVKGMEEMKDFIKENLSDTVFQYTEKNRKSRITIESKIEKFATVYLIPELGNCIVSYIYYPLRLKE